MPRITLLFLLISLPTLAQRIEGRVTDAATGAELPFATVFINNTSFATNADSTGRFALNNLPPGRYQLIARLVGYMALNQAVVVEVGKTARVDFSLVADKNTLNEVTAKAKRDKAWESNLKQFTRHLIGSEAPARLCRITNPWVIDFAIENGALTARASQPIEIENRYLGYQLTYVLQSFRATESEVNFSGYAQFMPLWSGKASDETAWDAQRQLAFRDSDLYFLQSLLAGKTAINGFEAYIDRLNANPANRSNNFYGDQVKKLQRIDLDTLARRQVNGPSFRVVLPRRFELHHTRAEGPFAIYRDKPCPLTWIDTAQPLLVNEQGLLLNPQAWSVSGFLASRRLSVMLPADYQPTNPEAFAAQPKTPSNRWTSRTEAPFFVTDRTYYSPRDLVQISGTMQYANPAQQDSLSARLHLQLLDPNTGKILVNQNIAIEQGQFQTAFVLPDSLETKPYLLRAYTNWQRNWSDSAVAYRWLPVVAFGQKPVGSTSPEAENLEISIVDSTVQVRVRDSPTGRFRWLVASLTDTSVVSQLATPVAFGFPISTTLPAPQFTIERGIGLSGQATNRKGQPAEGAQVLLVVPKTKASFVALADSMGRFSFTDLPLEGQQPVLLKATNSRGKSVETVTVLPETAPALTVFARTPPTLTMQQDPVPNWYGTLTPGKKADGSVQLAEVKVKAAKTPPAARSQYRQADYVVKGKDLAEHAVGENILVALQGRIPGLRVVEKFGEDGLRKLIITLRGGVTGGGFRQGEPTQPLLLVDGVPFGDVNELQAIPPSRIDRIEIVNRAEALMGLRGYLGVIAVYTKQMSDEETRAIETDPAIKQVTLTGWAADSIVAPRQTGVYWQPVPTDRGEHWELTFPRPARRGTYRLVCEGITTNGKRLVLVRHVRL